MSILQVRRIHRCFCLAVRQSKTFIIHFITEQTPAEHLGRVFLPLNCNIGAQLIHLDLVSSYTFINGFAVDTAKIHSFLKVALYSNKALSLLWKQVKTFSLRRYSENPDYVLLI